MKKILIKDKLEEINFNISSISLGDFDFIGEFTAKKSRDRNHPLFKTAGCFFRPNYERGLLIYSLITKFRLTSLLEIGFGRGYSTFCAAKAFQDAGINGKIVTVDPNLNKDFLEALSQVFPKEWFQMIEFHKATSQDLLPTMTDKYDLIYIDGDHTYDAVKSDWELTKDRYKQFLLFDDYHLPSKTDEGIECAKLIDSIEDDSKELIIMDRRIFFDDRRLPDSEIDYGQVLLSRSLENFSTNPGEQSESTQDNDYLDEWMDEDPSDESNNSLTLDEMNDVLLEREKEWPERREGYRKFINALSDFSDQIKSAVDGPDGFEIDNKLSKKFMNVGDAPVFILGNMKSGTTLMLHLLDGHTNLMCLPVDSHVLKHFNPRGSDEEIFQNLYSMWMRKLISPTGFSPFWIFGKDIEPYQKFAQHFIHNVRENLFQGDFKFFNAAAHAFACASPLKPKKNVRFVEKTPENELRLSDISSGYPNAKFIHILRDPMTNVASMKKFTENRNDIFHVDHVSKMIARGINLAKNNIEIVGNENYLIVKYEDILEDTKTVMKTVSEFLEVDFKRTLLTPTTQGYPATSNSMFDDRRVTGEVFTGGDDDSSVTRVRSVLSPEEIKRTVSNCETSCKEYDYDLKAYLAS